MNFYIQNHRKRPSYLNIYYTPAISYKIKSLLKLFIYKIIRADLVCEKEKSYYLLFLVLKLIFTQCMSPFAWESGSDLVKCRLNKGMHDCYEMNCQLVAGSHCSQLGLKCSYKRNVSCLNLVLTKKKMKRRME